MFGAPERLPAFGARTFPTVITTSMVLLVQDLNEKIIPNKFYLSSAMYTLTFKQLYTVQC
jgi:hypothetical protein